MVEGGFFAGDARECDEEEKADPDNGLVAVVDSFGVEDVDDKIELNVGAGSLGLSEDICLLQQSQHRSRFPI